MFWFQHYMKKCKHERGIYVRLVALLGIPVVWLNMGPTEPGRQKKMPWIA